MHRTGSPGTEPRLATTTRSSRCQDGAYGTRVDPSAADIATAIIEEFLEPDTDSPMYGTYHVLRLVRSGQSLADRPTADRIDATFDAYWAAANTASAVAHRRIATVTPGAARTRHRSRKTVDVSVFSRNERKADGSDRTVRR